ncbi:hypothetical protein V6N13_070045 [Hibiscus sabdariffa]
MYDEAAVGNGHSICDLSRWQGIGRLSSSQRCQLGDVSEPLDQLLSWFNGSDEFDNLFKADLVILLE